MYGTGPPQACHRRHAAVELDTTFRDDYVLNQRSGKLVEPKSSSGAWEQLLESHILSVSLFSVPARTSLCAADGWELHIVRHSFDIEKMYLSQCCGVYRATVRPRFYEVLAWMSLFAVDAA